MKPKKEPKRPTAKELGKIKAWIKSLTPEQREKLRELRTKIWWWRRGEIRHAFKNPNERAALGIPDYGSVKEAARNYELMRRSAKGENCYQKSYLELQRWEREVVYSLWGARFEPPYREIFNPSPKPESLGWTVSPHRIEWNLFYDDPALVKAFLEQINQYRIAQRIPSRHPSKGQKFRGVSWRQIEILDCKKWGVLTKLDRSQSSAESKGHRDAEKLFEIYYTAISATAGDTNSFNDGFSTDDDFNGC